MGTSSDMLLGSAIVPNDFSHMSSQRAFSFSFTIASEIGNRVHSSIVRQAQRDAFEITCAGVKRVDLPRVVWSDGCATRPAS